MHKIDIAALKALAERNEEATREWNACRSDMKAVYAWGVAERLFQQSATPTTILALLARLELAEAVADADIERTAGVMVSGPEAPLVRMIRISALAGKYNNALAAYCAAKIEGGMPDGRSN